MSENEETTPNTARDALRKLDEIEAYVTAELDQVRAELDSLTLGFNLTCVCIIALTVLVYLADRDRK